MKAGEAPGSVTWPLIAELDAEQAELEAERPTAAAQPVVARPEDFASLAVDRRRAGVESLAEAVVVVAKAARRGARWMPDRLEVIWRS